MMARYPVAMYLPYRWSSGIAYKERYVYEMGTNQLFPLASVAGEFASGQTGEFFFTLGF